MDITEEVNGRVFRRCRASTKGDYLSDDIAQEVLLNAWRYVDNFLPDKLLVMMIREKYHSVKRGVFEYEDIDNHADIVDENESNIFDLLREQFEQVRYKVKLTRKQRSVLSLIMEHDIPYTKAIRLVGVNDREYYKMIDKFKEVLSDV